MAKLKMVSNIDKCAIDDSFSLSKLFGNFDIREFNGKVLKDTKNYTQYKPIKTMVSRADIVLKQSVINKLINAPKFLVGDIQCLSSQKTDYLYSTDANIPMVDENNRLVYSDYYISEKNSLGKYEQYYEKVDKDLNNKGVYFFASNINGKTHMFALNVMESGLTGASVSLVYLPKGDMNNAILLERVCYHGNKGNEHKNLDGTIIEKNDLHIHKVTQDFMNNVVSSRQLSRLKKIEKLNFPDAQIIAKNVDDNKVNIAKILKIAKKEMSLCAMLDPIYSDENISLASALNSNIEFISNNFTMENSYMGE